MSLSTILEGAVDPRSYAERRGLACRGGVYHLPGYGGILLAGGGFVSDLPQDLVFRAGSVLDTEALALRSAGSLLRGSALYLEAVRRLFRLFSDRLPEPDPDAACGVADEALARRRLLDLFFSDGVPGDTGESLAGWLRVPARMDVVRFPRGIMYFSPALFSRLLDLLQRIGLPQKLKVRGYLVRPWFSAPHRLCSIDLRTRMSSPEPPIRIRIEQPYAEYSGLADYDMAKTALLASDPDKAQTLCAELARASLGAQALGIRTDLGGDPSGLWVPDGAVFLQDEDSLDGLAEAMALDAQGRGIPVGRLGATAHMCASGALPVEEVVLKRVMDALHESKGWTSELEALFRTCRMGASLRKRVREGMEALGLDEAADRLDAMFPDKLLATAGRLSVYASQAGYRIRRGAGEPEPLSNFTLEFTRNVSFGQAEGILHEGKAVMAAREVPFMLRGDDLSSPSRLDSALKRADLSEAGDLPALFQMAEARLLCRHLREEAARMPVAQGLRWLGWDAARRKFSGPGFHAEAGVSEARRAVAHPGSDVLGCYAMRETPLRHAPLQKGWGSAGHVLVASAAYVVRCHLGLPLFPVPVANTHGSRAVLSGVFAGLGQECAARLGRNKRKTELVGVEGFPLYMEGYSSAQVQGSRLPGFVLADEGEELYASPASIAAAAELFPDLLASVARLCVEGSLGPFSEARATSRLRRLVLEGLQACTAPQGFQAPPEAFPHLAKWMDGGGAVRYDLARQTLLLCKAGNTVLKEMLTLDREASESEGGVLVRAVPVSPVLELWYGKVPYVV